MAAEMSNSFPNAYPMNAGTNLHSYAKNSTLQKIAIDVVKDLINEEFLERLDLQNISLSRTVRLVDMGCSTGPNTFTAVQNIIDAVQKKYQLQETNSEQLEFLVFLNDHVSNDFNTLFNSLPPNRQYFAVGVPGSFYGSLFPNASLDIVHSSNALVWLSQVPRQVVDKTSPAYNKGMITYSSEAEDTAKAFTDQFAKDLDCFLHFRAKEVVPGGLIILVVPCRSDETPHSQVIPIIQYHLLGSCLTDMAKKGIISEEKVDSFNIPVYICSPKEVESAVERNGHFSIERLECIPYQKSKDNNDITVRARLLSSHARAGLEVLLKDHFGSDIMDDLFDSFTKKLGNLPIIQHGTTFTLFVLLKRKSGN